MQPGEVPPESLTETEIFLPLCFIFVIIPCWICVIPSRGGRVSSHALQKCRHSPGSEDCVNLRLKIFTLLQFNRSFKRHNSHVIQHDPLWPKWGAANSNSSFWLLWGKIFSLTPKRKIIPKSTSFSSQDPQTVCSEFKQPSYVFKAFSLHFLLPKWAVK